MKKRIAFALMMALAISTQRASAQTQTKKGVVVDKQSQATIPGVNIIIAGSDPVETLVSPELFFRINRKVMVNINAITKVGSYFNSRLIITSPHLTSEDSIVSHERVNDFKLWLDK